MQHISVNHSADGSLHIDFENAVPGGNLESKELPAQREPFNFIVRPYAPKSRALSEKWNPPPVVRDRGPASLQAPEELLWASMFGRLRHAPSWSSAPIRRLRSARPSRINGRALRSSSRHPNHQSGAGVSGNFYTAPERPCRAPNRSKAPLATDRTRTHAHVSRPTWPQS